MTDKRDVVVYSEGVGFLGLLTLLFVALKLTGHVDWSWWWVTLPFWGPFALLIGGCAIFLALMVPALAVAWVLGWRERRRT